MHFLYLTHFVVYICSLVDTQQSISSLFVYCDKVQVQNTGNKQLTNVIALISRENLTASKNYLTFRPMKLQYVPVLQNIDSITSIYVKIASENGIKLEVGKGGATETRISLHACSEKYLT